MPGYPQRYLKANRARGVAQHRLLLSGASSDCFGRNIFCCRLGKEATKKMGLSKDHLNLVGFVVCRFVGKVSKNVRVFDHSTYICLQTHTIVFIMAVQ